MKDFQDACEESTFSKVDDDPFFISVNYCFTNFCAFISSCRALVSVSV